MNLGDFKTKLREALNRGTTLDSLLTGVVNAAIKFYEANYTIQYQYTFVEFTLVEGTGDEAIELPTLCKNFRWIRVVDEDDDGDIIYRYLTKTLPERIVSMPEGEPTQYWIDGNQYIRFDTVLDDTYTFEMYYVKYSTALASDNDEHWFFDGALYTELLLAKCVEIMSPHVRDVKLLQLYKSQVEQYEKVLFNQEANFEFEGMELVMEDRVVYD